jgi:hypothetical protein
MQFDLESSEHNASALPGLRTRREPCPTRNFNAPSTTVDLVNPRTFDKISSGPLTPSFGGQPVMNLKLELTW